MAAARAAAGLEGVTTVHDYRGAAVLAATRKVPGSTWAVVAKVDEVEIYGSTLFRVCIIVVAVFAALLVAAGCAVYAWHRDQGEHYRELYEAEMARKELELHYEYLTRHANDCILLLDAHQRIIEANERAQDTYGYTSEAFRTLNASDLRAETARSNFEQQFQRAVRKGGGIYETLHRRNDGSVFPAEVSVRAIRTASGLFYPAIIRDTTEKKKHEAMIARVNRLNGLLAKVAQAMLRVDDASEFYSTLCRLAVEQGGFKAASVSLVFGDQVARPTACYGIPAEAVRACDAALGDDAPETLMRAALIDGTIQVSNDLIADLRTAPMRTLAQAESYVAAAVCPFRSKNDVVGAIALFSSQRDSFGEPERHVLATLTADISYAVDALAPARERDQALLALRANSALLRKISDNVPAMVWISDAAGTCTYANRRGFEFAGTSNIQELAEWWMQAVHPEDRQRCSDAYEEAMRSRREMDVEYRLRHADGNYHWVQNRGVPHFLEDGTFSGFVGACTDITGRKEQEFALRRTEALWRSALECADAGVWTRDLSTNTVTVCERFKQLFGFQPGEDAPLVAIAGRVHPSDRARVLTRVTDNSEAYEDHHRVIWADGSEHWMCSRGRVEQDEQGTPIRLVAVVTDVTARMHESKLKFTHASIAELARALDGAASQTAVV